MGRSCRVGLALSQSVKGSLIASNLDVGVRDPICERVDSTTSEYKQYRLSKRCAVKFVKGCECLIAENS
jgi:hypothetical protein